MKNARPPALFRPYVNRRKQLDKKCIGVKPRFICEFMLAVETAKITLMAYSTNGTGLNTVYTESLCTLCNIVCHNSCRLIEFGCQ